MKKFFLVLIALFLVILPVCAQEEEEVWVANWEDYVDKFVEEGFSGQFYTYSKLGFEMMIPDGLGQAEFDPELTETRGIIDIYSDEEKEKLVVVSFQNLGCETLDEVKALIVDDVDGATFGYARFNGLNALLFTNPYELTASALIGAGDGYYLQITIGGLEYEYMRQVVNYIFASIRPISE